MNYGFAIDNSACIGCHACSTACKSENEVPLGVARTWVKYTETGVFPDVRRNFQVTRCNHCANPPCVRICPVNAMYQRDDGIVEFDTDACIGCKGCLQACPYDAIHIDPETHTAAKCHFCSHRLDVGLEPACVVVCPEHAIIAGDLDDPHSEVSRIIAKNNVTVRKPEQGTSPKLFYVEGSAHAMHPTAATQPESFVWAEVAHEEHALPEEDAAEVVIAQGVVSHPTGHTVRTPATQGLPPAGAVALGGTRAEQMVQVAFNQQHAMPWHWPIPMYVVTKHIAGGIFFLLAVAVFTPALALNSAALVGGGALALLMTLVTLVLLVYDLDRPDRFFYLLIRPQWRSWIARAAWILSGFTALAGAWWLAEVGGTMGWVDPAPLRPWFAAATAPLAIMTSIYTAFLFAQAEGRDLWQGPHLPVQMAVHGLMLGAGAFVAMATFVELPASLYALCHTLFLWTAVASLIGTILADRVIPHASEVARAGAREMMDGRYRRYWLNGLLVGQLLPAVVLATGLPLGGLIAFLAACGGLFAYEYAFIMAAQRVPNS